VTDITSTSGNIAPSGKQKATLSAADLEMRDYFAAKAMQGLIAASGDSNGVVDYAENPIADSAYAMADSMLRARGE
jgi:hypothetical protein